VSAEVIRYGWIELADGPWPAGTTFETEIENHDDTLYGIVLRPLPQGAQVVLFETKRSAVEAWYRLHHKGRFRAPREPLSAA
jgi:hypothetical protein